MSSYFELLIHFWLLAVYEPDLLLLVCLSVFVCFMSMEANEVKNDGMKFLVCFVVTLWCLQTCDMNQITSPHVTFWNISFKRQVPVLHFPIQIRPVNIHKLVIKWTN